MLVGGGGGGSAGLYVDHAGVLGMAGSIRSDIAPLFATKATLAAIMSAAQAAAGEFSGSLHTGTDDLNSKMGSAFEELALNIQLQGGFLVTMSNAISDTDSTIASGVHNHRAQ